MIIPASVFELVPLATPALLLILILCVMRLGVELRGIRKALNQRKN